MTLDEVQDGDVFIHAGYAYQNYIYLTISVTRGDSSEICYTWLNLCTGKVIPIQSEESNSVVLPFWTVMRGSETLQLGVDEG